MAKKKELVENFQQIIDSGDLEAFKKVFDTCEISATKAPEPIGKGKRKFLFNNNCNAFSYKNLTPAHIQFLIDSGLDPNSNCGYGYSAITFQSSNKENLKCLLDNGADLECVVSPQFGTALTIACMCLDTEGARNLIDAGASINSAGVEDALIDLALCHSDENHVAEPLRIAKMLLDHGAETTEDTKDCVSRVGAFFEAKKDELDKEQIDELAPIMNELYRRFELTPVVVSDNDKHDDVSVITVRGNTWKEQYNELWAKLVPASGKAQTVQGEMIRIIGKVSYEILDNGGLNWGGDYKKMLKALSGFMNSFDSSGNAPVDEATGIIKKISASTDEKPLNRLTEIIVDLIISNPQPVPLGEVTYEH